MAFWLFVLDASITLSTSSYIGEGIDIGHLDTIVFAMPISYSERIIQYLGRIGRKGQQCLAIDKNLLKKVSPKVSLV